jgi:glucose uptake protein
MRTLGPMIFPTTNLATLLLLTLALICWGSWANMQKYLGQNKWRFELFYFDFALGVALTMAVAAYSLGSMNSQELTFQDNLLITGYRKIAYALAAGAVFNVGNMLLVAAIALAGMAPTFLIAFGTAGILGVVFAYAANPHTNPILAFGGAVLFLMAVAVAAFAYTAAADAIVATETKSLRPDLRARNAPARRIGPGRAIILSVASGIFIGLSRPLVDWAREGENGIAPYGVALLFGVGLFVTALIAVPFFINFPVQGVPIQAKTYFKGTKLQHIFGVFAGIVWGVGALSAWVSLAAPVSVQASPALTYVFLEGAAVLAAIWGLMIWKDLDGKGRSKTYGAGSLVLFLAAIGMVSASYLK